MICLGCGTLRMVDERHRTAGDVETKTTTHQCPAQQHDYFENNYKHEEVRYTKYLLLFLLPIPFTVFALLSPPSQS